MSKQTGRQLGARVRMGVVWEGGDGCGRAGRRVGRGVGGRVMEMT